MSTNFNASWLTHPNYNDWLMEVKSSPTSAYCKTCYKTFSLSNMGKRALDSHAKSKKHLASLSVKSKCAAIKDFVKIESSKGATDDKCRSDASSLAHTEGDLDTDTSQLTVPPPTDSSPHSEQNVSAESIAENNAKPAPSTSKLSKWMQSKESRKAEIVWTLRCVKKHQSFRSNEKIAELFQKMFWDSNIARQFSMGKTKQSYLVIFGLAPYFKDMLTDSIKDCRVITAIFDEAFNDVLQKDQMDILVKFWKADKVVTRYLGSQFLGRGKAEDLLGALKLGMSDVDPSKIIQIGMDGPNVNLKLHKLYVEDRQKLDPGMPEIIDIGTCSLHVVHGAFRTGIQKSGWDLERILKSLWSLFHDTYERRTTYTDITGSDVFPLKFCATRWVEDAPVAARALDIWSNIVKYITTMLAGKKSSMPTCNSFQVLCEAVKDKMIVAKLEFFIFIARKLQPLLTKYQDDRPLIIFLGTDLTELLLDLMGLFIKESVLGENRTGYKLATLNVENKANHLPTKNIGVGNGAKRAIHLLGDEISELQKMQFLSSCLDILQAVVTKLQERSPLKYSFLRGLKAFDPHFMVQSQSPSTALKTVTNKLTITKRCSAEKCDEAEAQYKRFIMESRKDLEKFDPKQQRLDEFFFSLLDGRSEYASLWHIIQMTLVLSHGQAPVERSFSLNDDILLPNMKQMTLCAMKMVFDAVQDIDIHSFDVPDKMLQYCNQARAKYDQYQLEQKAKKDKEAQKRKTAASEEEFIEAKKKVKLLQNEADSCILNADKKAKEALKKHDFTLLAQSVALSEQGKKLKKEAEKQAENVQKLKDKITFS